MINQHHLRRGSSSATSGLPTQWWDPWVHRDSWENPLEALPKPPTPSLVSVSRECWWMLVNAGSQQWPTLTDYYQMTINNRQWQWKMMVVTVAFLHIFGVNECQWWLVIVMSLIMVDDMIIDGSSTTTNNTTGTQWNTSKFQDRLVHHDAGWSTMVYTRGWQGRVPTTRAAMITPLRLVRCWLRIGWNPEPPWLDIPRKMTTGMEPEWLGCEVNYWFSEMLSRILS